MDWNGWTGKKIFLRTIKGKVYSGNVEDVEDIGNGIIFLSLIDKFGKLVMVVTSEIIEIKEEE